MTLNKYKLLRQSILMDLGGMITSFIPVIGPFLDILWAPFAAKKMNDMYKGTSGKVATIAVFLEEILFFDLLPTFTLMWLYTFVLSSEKNQELQPIKVKVNE